MFDPMKTKECTTCHIVKPISHFDADPRYKSGVRSQCRQCRYDAMQRKSLDAQLRGRYGVDVEWYEAQLARQDGVCGICKKPESRRSRLKGKPGITSKSTTRLSVDHDHATGEVRGLLCQRCNIAIGHLMDDIDYLKNAIAYIEEYSA